MKRVTPIVLGTLAILATVHASGAATARAAAGTVPTFAKDVAPIVFDNCASLPPQRRSGADDASRRTKTCGRGRR